MSDRLRRQQEDDRHFQEADLNGPSCDQPMMNCRALAVMVIEQARDDVRGKTAWRTRLKYPGECRERARQREEAYAFLTGATPEWRTMLEEWCEVIDWDPEVLVADAKAGCVGAMVGQRQVARMPRRNDESLARSPFAARVGHLSLENEDMAVGAGERGTETKSAPSG